MTLVYARHRTYYKVKVPFRYIATSLSLPTRFLNWFHLQFGRFFYVLVMLGRSGHICLMGLFPVLLNIFNRFRNMGVKIIPSRWQTATMYKNGWCNNWNFFENRVGVDVPFWWFNFEMINPQIRKSFSRYPRSLWHFFIRYKFVIAHQGKKSFSIINVCVCVFYLNI